MPETSDPRVIARELEAHISKVVRDLAIEATANLIEATPVDTGWARASWVPQIGSPYTSRVAGIGQTSGPQRVGLASLLAYRVNQGAIWISNHVPYIRILDGGSSKQAPAGFVRLAISRALSSMRQRSRSRQ